MKIEVQIVLCVIFAFANPQFTSRRRSSKTPCEVHGTALVEQFFNVVFAEFQHSPPKCTCVQMCADQPTYCYPNGCYRRIEKKKETPVSSIQQDAKTVFLVDNDNDKDIIDDLMGDVNRIAASSSGNAEKTYQNPRDSLAGRANPSKEIVFKYKRLPKLQMKYNLREQIKHARDKKAEVDLSKTRWPTNKQINRQINHQRTSNYLTSVFSETNQQEAPKYFKRYLTKRENQIGLDISALYLYKDASNFSLEALIDNLIERGLDGANSTFGSLSNSSQPKDNENNCDIKLMNGAEDLQNETNEINMKISLLSKDNDNEKRNKNFNQTNSSTAAYSEMITTLSKQIEKQNNLSMEVIGNLTGSKFNDFFKKNSVNISDSNGSDRLQISPKVAEEIKSATDTVPTSRNFNPIINSQIKKSKQRIVRKLRNRKLN